MHQPSPVFCFASSINQMSQRSTFPYLSNMDLLTTISRFLSNIQELQLTRSAVRQAEFRPSSEPKYGLPLQHVLTRSYFSGYFSRISRRFHFLAPTCLTPSRLDKNCVSPSSDHHPDAAASTGTTTSPNSNQARLGLYRPCPATSSLQRSNVNHNLA